MDDSAYSPSALQCWFTCFRVAPQRVFWVGNSAVLQFPIKLESQRQFAGKFHTILWNSVAKMEEFKKYLADRLLSEERPVSSVTAPCLLVLQLMTSPDHISAAQQGIGCSCEYCKGVSREVTIKIETFADVL